MKDRREKLRPWWPLLMIRRESTCERENHIKEREEAQERKEKEKERKRERGLSAHDQGPGGGLRAGRGPGGTRPASGGIG